MASAPLDRLGGVTLTQLTYAVAVDAHRHFGRAADACRVTQPTLSMQLRKLERSLGVPLFDRTRTPVVPTEAGRALLAQARLVLVEAGRLAEAVAGADPSAGAGQAALAGELRVAVIPTLAPYLLPAVIARMARQHPGLVLVVEELVTDQAIASVTRGASALALVATPTGSNELAETALFEEPFVGYVAPSHRLATRRPLRSRDLALDDVWLLTEGHCLRAQTVAICRAARTPARRASHALHARFESGNIETLKRLVEQGMGMTLLPALATTALAPSQRALLRPFAAPVPSREIRAVHRRAHAGDRRIDAVLDVVGAVGRHLLADGARARRPAGTPD